MRKRFVPAMAAILWIGASGAGLGAETIAGPSTGKDASPPKEVRASCGTIAAILAVYPTFVVKTSEGPVRVERDGRERAGCRVKAAGPSWGLVGEVPPERALRDLMGQLGWEEDLRYIGGGPGTFSFALRRERVLCLISGGAPSGKGDGSISRAGTYELEVGCAAPDVER